MTSKPASRSARAMTLAPRSWPSRPGLAIRTRARGTASALIRLHLVGRVRPWWGLTRRLIDLDQHPVGALRVDERDHADRARVGDVVDELCPACLELAHLRFDVVHLEADVVQAGPAALEEARDGVVGGERRDELDLRVAGADEHDVELTILEAQATGDRQPEHVAIEHHRPLEVVDGDADVVQLLDRHGSPGACEARRAVAG